LILNLFLYLLLRIIYLLHHTNYNLLRMFYSSLTALIIHPFYSSFLFLHKTLMARNGLLCADVPLRNYSIKPSNCCSLPFSHSPLVRPSSSGRVGVGGGASSRILKHFKYNCVHQKLGVSAKSADVITLFDGLPLKILGRNMRHTPF